MLEVLTVIGLFVLRIGVPIMLLVGLGLLIDRWQTHRAAAVRRMQQPDVIDLQNYQAEEDEIRKAA